MRADAAGRCENRESRVIGQVRDQRLPPVILGTLLVNTCYNKRDWIQLGHRLGKAHVERLAGSDMVLGRVGRRAAVSVGICSKGLGCELGNETTTWATLTGFKGMAARGQGGTRSLGKSQKR